MAYPSTWAYDEYMRLLAQVKELIAQGRDESEEAEKLREKMDALWFQIPERKRAEINKNVEIPKAN